jgi:hypothetical protein
MEVIAQIIQTIVYGIVALVALLVALLIAVSMMPKDNPLHQLLAALVRPVAVMVGAGVIAVPVEFIPGVDVIYDIAALIVIALSWFKFFKSAREIWPQVISHAAAAAPAGDPNLTAAECFGRAQDATKRMAYTEALRWYRLAAERGHSAAIKFLEGAGQAQPKQDEPRSGHTMSPAEAREILDLTENPTDDDIRAAHTRLMMQLHPDRGGSTFFAKKINTARDVLLAGQQRGTQT